MRVCAVICEYNPFHLGHAYHLRAAREASGADYVLCLMSGALTQRGAFARHDKWLRARAALENGADLVLELPTRFACAPAPDFASGGVALLSALGVATHLSFGCEASALPLLSAAAALFKAESPAFSAALRARLADGLPYPRARALAAGLPATLLAQPNAALALEYLQALPPEIAPVPVERRGSGYHDAALSSLSSATAVRAALARGGLTAALAAVPSPEALRAAEESGFVHEEEALTQALLYRLRTASPAELAALFPDLTVACIHGRMKPKEKDAVMAAVVAGEVNILVATTVIEVGVDVPNAALMIIENAERFGLSQLHQLRGRVGRGKHKSYCVLVSDNDSEDVRARLSIMTKTNDGFKISEEDLRLRGPGDFFGSRQHGLPEMHVADLGADMNVMQRAQSEAQLLLAADPELALPEHAALRQSVERMLRVNADSFN